MTYEAFEMKYGLTAPRAAYLISHFLRQLLNDTEWKELDDWITTNNDNMVLFENMIEPERFEKESLAWYSTGVGELEEKVLKALLKEDKVQQPIYRMMWFRVAAASVIIGAIIIGALLVFTPRKDWTQINATIATITTPDGKQIESTKVGDKPQAVEGGGIISQSGGELKYSFNGKQMRDDRYYVVQVPAPFLYKMTLQDGSKLWFAANTVVRYPEAFSINERAIEVRGHIYIEIAADARPFVVKFSNGQITSRDGQFDVSDFKGQYSVVITAKGSGELKRDYAPVQQLKEGFRTTLEENAYTRHERVDVESYTGWRHGVIDGMKQIFERNRKGEILRMYDSVYNK